MSKNRENVERDIPFREQTQEAKEFSPEIIEKIEGLDFRIIHHPMDNLWYRTPDGHVGITQSGVGEWSEATDAHREGKPGWSFYDEHEQRFNSEAQDRLEADLEAGRITRAEYDEQIQQMHGPSWLSDAILKAKILFFNRHGLPLNQGGLDKFNQILEFDRHQWQEYEKAQEAHKQVGKPGYPKVPPPSTFIPGEEDKPWSKEWSRGFAIDGVRRGVLPKWNDLKPYLEEVTVPLVVEGTQAENGGHEGKHAEGEITKR